MRPGQVAAAAVCSVVLLVGLGFASRAPIPGVEPGTASLRLTWRVRGEEIGECRRPTQAELEALPTHMRNPEACVGANPPFRLRVLLDGTVRIDERVEATGARGDRPLYVYRDLALEEGRHQVEIAFTRDDSDGSSVGPGFSLEFHDSIELGEGEVLLLTRGPDGRLEARDPER